MDIGAKIYLTACLLNFLMWIFSKKPVVISFSWFVIRQFLITAALFGYLNIK